MADTNEPRSDERNWMVRRRTMGSKRSPTGLRSSAIAPPLSNSSSSSSSSSSSFSWIHLLSVLFVANPSSPFSVTLSDRSRRKSPWPRRKRKWALTPHQWKSLFTPEGKLRNGGVGFLKKVRSRSVDPSIRAEVWMFLLGV